MHDTDRNCPASKLGCCFCFQILQVDLKVQDAVVEEGGVGAEVDSEEEVVVVGVEEVVYMYILR